MTYNTYVIDDLQYLYLSLPIIRMCQNFFPQWILWGLDFNPTYSSPDFVVPMLKNYNCNQNKIKNNRKVIGIDVDIRKHNKEKLNNHFLSEKMVMIEASSVELKTFEKVKEISQDFSNILVILDSNHTDEHVLKELNLYGSLVSQNSYCIVFDTIIEKLDDAFSKDRPWSKKNSPKSAIEKFLKTNESFEIDYSVDDRLILSMAPGGFLKKIR